MALLWWWIVQIASQQGDHPASDAAAIGSGAGDMPLGNAHITRIFLWVRVSGNAITRFKDHGGNGGAAICGGG